MFIIVIVHWEAAGLLSYLGSLSCYFPLALLGPGAPSGQSQLTELLVAQLMELTS